MTDQSRLQRALLFAGIDELAPVCKYDDEALAQRLMAGGVLYTAVASLLLWAVDERVHPIARVVRRTQPEHPGVFDDEPAHPAPASPPSPTVQRRQPEVLRFDLSNPAERKAAADTARSMAEQGFVVATTDECQACVDIAKFSDTRVPHTCGKPNEEDDRSEYEELHELRAERDTLRARVEFLEAEVTRDRSEGDSWRRVAERLEREKVDGNARIQQLEGELAGVREGLPMRDAEMRERGRREAESERDTLRAALVDKENKLQQALDDGMWARAKSDELQRAHDEWRVLFQGAVADIAKRDAVVEAVAEMDKVYRAPGTDADDVIAVYQSRVMPAMRALSALDQPSEPKT